MSTGIPPARRTLAVQRREEVANEGDSTDDAAGSDGGERPELARHDERNVMDEIGFGGRNIKRGAPKSMQVKRVQEWLNLHGIGLKVDSDFGPATENGVKQFQKKQHLPVTGVVDKKTFDLLVAPMRAALKPIPPNGKSLNQLIIAYARQHIAQRPREVGGQNRGPWVRLYMDGDEGPGELWCAGFATYPIKQAATELHKSMPVLRSFGVANIADDAKAKHHFLELPGPGERKRIKPGSLFLERGKPPKRYQHCGIVIRVNGDTMATVEGNTNDDGSNNGFEAIARTRGFKDMDFALV
jgi:Putative peptidoglycan binding domain